MPDDSQNQFLSGKRLAAGFTLVEIAAVLLIIGFVAGGILLGRTMIRNAEIKNMQSNYQKYITAVNTFMTKYDCLPGDCSNAEDIFGADTCPPASDAPQNDKTCNGNGNWIIDVWTGGPSESFQAWEHLALAGMIEGQYSGTYTTSTTTGFKSYYNCPPLINDSFCFFWVPPEKNGTMRAAVIETETHALYTMPNNINAVFGGPFIWTINNTSDRLGVLTPEEALIYDTKYDDGSPITGSIAAAGPGISADCTTTFDQSAQYDTSKKGTNCAFLFDMGI